MRPTVLLHDSQETLVHRRCDVRDRGSRALGYRATSSGGTTDCGSGHSMEPDAAADHPHTRRSAPATVHPARNLAIMTSVKYAAALQEVQRQGEVHSAARAADQTQVANVWAAPIQNYWNEIAPTAALELLGSGERGGSGPDLRRAARPTRPDLRHRTGRDVRTACSATTFNLAGR
jgi:hypothetical protein